MLWWRKFLISGLKNRACLIQSMLIAHYSVHISISQLFCLSVCKLPIGTCFIISRVLQTKNENAPGEGFGSPNNDVSYDYTLDRSWPIIAIMGHCEVLPACHSFSLTLTFVISYLSSHRLARYGTAFWITNCSNDPNKFQPVISTSLLHHNIWQTHATLLLGWANSK